MMCAEECPGALQEARDATCCFAAFAQSTRRRSRHIQVLLNAPNCVGWLRIALLAAAIAAAEPLRAWWLVLIALALDGLDGWLARRLNQVCMCVYPLRS